MSSVQLTAGVLHKRCKVPCGAEAAPEKLSYPLFVKVGGLDSSHTRTFADRSRRSRTCTKHCASRGTEGLPAASASGSNRTGSEPAVACTRRGCMHGGKHRRGLRARFRSTATSTRPIRNKTHLMSHLPAEGPAIAQAQFDACSSQSRPHLEAFNHTPGAWLSFCRGWRSAGARRSTSAWKPLALMAALGPATTASAAPP